MRIKTLLTGTAVSVVLAMGMASTAQAALVTVSATISYPPSGNDCSGIFGTSPNCNVEGPDDADGVTLFSPLIVKYDINDDGSVDPTINKDLYPTFSGSEVSFGGGTWSYTPGSGDPGIKYWVAKGGNTGTFNLFWSVDAAETAVGGACAVTVYSDACLAMAQVVLGGAYSVPGGFGLSHLTLYNTGDEYLVPLPAAAWLLLSGLLGLGALGRRKVPA